MKHFFFFFRFKVTFLPYCSSLLTAFYIFVQNTTKTFNLFCKSSFFPFYLSFLIHKAYEVVACSSGHICIASLAHQHFSMLVNFNYISQTSWMTPSFYKNRMLRKGKTVTETSSILPLRIFLASQVVSAVSAKISVGCQLERKGKYAFYGKSCPSYTQPFRMDQAIILSILYIFP